MPTASIAAIYRFCFAVARRVTIPDVAALCEGAVVNTASHFASCPNPLHRLTEHHVTHCSYGGDGDGHIYHCFSCGTSGDSVTYVAQWLGISNFSAARLINRSLKLAIPDPCDPIKQ